MAGAAGHGESAFAIHQEAGPSLRRWTLKFLCGWLGLELGAAIVALSLVIATGPWIAVLLSRPENWELASAGVLSVSLPLAYLFGSSALNLSRELFADAAHS